MTDTTTDNSKFKHRLAIAGLGLAFVLGTMAWVEESHAQEEPQQEPQQVVLVPVDPTRQDAFDFEPPMFAYVTADPVEPTRYGLATPKGRYAFYALSHCESLAVGDNVGIYAPAFGGGYVPGGGGYWIGPAEPGVPGVVRQLCLIDVIAQMDPTPCFMTDGQCDYAAEMAPL